MMTFPEEPRKRKAKSDLTGVKSRCFYALPHSNKKIYLDKLIICRKKYIIINKVYEYLALFNSWEMKRNLSRIKGDYYRALMGSPHKAKSMTNTTITKPVRLLR